jgi:uncharacterized RDD family membrane protein YckC
MDADVSACACDNSRAESGQIIRVPDNISDAALPPQATVLRRFGAMLYDALVVAALLFVVTALLLPLTGGEAILSESYGVLVGYAYQALLIGIVVVFFGWFWTRRGQTLGMQAWRLMVTREDGSRLTWSDVIKRLSAALVSLAPLGLGYFWIWIDRDRLTWHDRWTHTRVIVLPKQ